MTSAPFMNTWRLCRWLTIRNYLLKEPRNESPHIHDVTFSFALFFSNGAEEKSKSVWERSFGWDQCSACKAWLQLMPSFGAKNGWTPVCWHCQKKLFDWDDHRQDSKPSASKLARLSSYAGTGRSKWRCLKDCRVDKFGYSKFRYRGSKASINRKIDLNGFFTAETPGTQSHAGLKTIYESVKALFN